MNLSRHQKTIEEISTKEVYTERMPPMDGDIGVSILGTLTGNIIRWIFLSQEV